jgi:GcrA cell cycle regulator
MKKKSNDSPITAQEQVIIDLWQENISAQEIADRLGVTKNTIVGKVTRIRNRGYDLRKRKPPEQVVAVARRTSVPKPVVPWVPAPRADPVIEPKTVHVAGPKRLMDLGIDDCRYVISGELASSYLFCGEPKAGKTYCAAHHKLCYVKPPAKVKGKTFSLKKLTYMSSYHFKDSFI